MRCDANGDGTLQLSDAIFTLTQLFLGGPEGPCQAATDCNADASLNLSDAAFGLNFLFAGGRSPQPPFPDCETADETECAATTCATP